MTVCWQPFTHIIFFSNMKEFFSPKKLVIVQRLVKNNVISFYMQFLLCSRWLFALCYMVIHFVWWTLTASQKSQYTKHSQKSTQNLSTSCSVFPSYYSRFNICGWKILVGTFLSIPFASICGPVAHVNMKQGFEPTRNVCLHNPLDESAQNTIVTQDKQAFLSFCWKAIFTINKICQYLDILLQQVAAQTMQ